MRNPVRTASLAAPSCEINLAGDECSLRSVEGIALAVHDVSLTESLVMDYLTRSRAMAAFCRQRAKMQNEDTNFWLREAEVWAKRAESRVLKMPVRKKKRARNSAGPEVLSDRKGV